MEMTTSSTTISSDLELDFWICSPFFATFFGDLLWLWAFTAIIHELYAGIGEEVVGFDPHHRIFSGIR